MVNTNFLKTKLDTNFLKTKLVHGKEVDHVIIVKSLSNSFSESTTVQGIATPTSNDLSIQPQKII